MLWFLLSCARTLAPGASSVPAPAADAATLAVAHPDRSAEDRERDADRRPADVLHFFGVAPGQAVVELMAGKGWYTELLARTVGPAGRVVAQNNAYVLEKFAEGPLSERMSRPGLERVVRLDNELDALVLDDGAYDAVLMVLFYHDAVWMEVDRAAMNAAVFQALKPGGVYGIVDHRAEVGSGLRDVKSLHRIDEDTVRAEVLAAGFALDAASEVLAHPEDARTINVFDEAIRGRTDRFVLRFVKP